MAKSLTTQQLLVLSSSARSHGMNPADTRVLPAKLFISGSPSDKDVKHLSIERIQVLSGINKTKSILVIPRVLAAKAFISGSPSEKDVKDQSNVNVPTNLVRDL
ncbi:uncharacterized protein [Rhodnius prolixus]|uniref:uncharacterized protein n=1 Tax=Rhodnius prolixus TaxID=13249 RepID=UPI003D1895BC